MKNVEEHKCRELLIETPESIFREFLIETHHNYKLKFFK
jgi:hypothetical protein